MAEHSDRLSAVASEGLTSSQALKGLYNVTTPYKAALAVSRGAAAALILAAMNVLSGLITLSEKDDIPTLVGSAPSVVASAHFVAAGLAVALYWFLARCRSVAAALLLLAWAVAGTLPIITATLYGHSAPFLMRGLVLLLAILGLRGVLALRRHAAVGDGGDPAVAD